MNDYMQYLPFAVNLAFLGVGYWAGTRGPAKIWQDLTGDVADIKNKIESLNAKITTTASTVAVAPHPVVVAHPAAATPVVASPAVVA